MKKPILLIFPIILFLFSCSQDNNEPEVVVDYQNFSVLTNWLEIESKVGEAKSEVIIHGDTLSLFSDFNESVRPRNGVYIYKSNNFHIDEGETGSFVQKNDSLSFFLKDKTDIKDRRTTVKYEINGDILMIKNKSIEVKYKRLNSK